MTEAYPCPYGDAEPGTFGQLLTHLAGHLTEGAAESGPAMQLLEMWRESPASRTTAGRSQEILTRLLAVGVQNHETGAALQEIAATVPGQVEESQDDRDAIRRWLLDIDVELASHAAKVAALEAKVAALEDPATNGERS